MVCGSSIVQLNANGKILSGQIIIGQFLWRKGTVVLWFDVRGYQNARVSYQDQKGLPEDSVGN
jgi:hypothetical protein